MPLTMPDFSSLPTGADYRHIPDFPGYAVGSDGSVWSCRPRGKGTGYVSVWRQLKPTPITRLKYPSVNLRKEGDTILCYVHRLVLLAFVGPCPEGMQACHKDGDPFNNRLENLRWDTRIANCADMNEHGTQPRGLTHYNAKLTPDAVRRIRQLRAAGFSYAHIGVNFGICQATVFSIANRKTWKHIV